MVRGNDYFTPANTRCFGCGISSLNNIITTSLIDDVISLFLQKYMTISTREDNKSSILQKVALAVVDTIREPVLVLNNELKPFAANQNFYRSFNLSAGSAGTVTLAEIAGEDHQVTALEKLLQDLLKNEQNFTDLLLNMVVRGKGQKNFLVNGSLLPGETPGENLILLAFKLREEPEHEEKNFLNSLHNILAHAPAMIGTLRGPEHVIEIANENLLQLLGNREVIGKTVRTAVPEVGNQGFFELLDEVYRTGEPFIGNELPIRLGVAKDEQKDSVLNLLYQPTFNSAGEVDGIFVHVVDVTEQVLLRKKIEQSEKELRKLMDTVPALIWVTSKSGHSTYLNKNWYNYTGQAPKEAEGFGWIDAIHPKEKGIAEKAFLKANKEQESYNVTYRLRTKSGEYRWVIDNGRPKYDINGNYDGMIGTVMEVHDVKIKEQIIREKEHRLRAIVEEATVATAVYTGPEMKIELANEAMLDLWGKESSVVGRNLGEALPELEGQPYSEILENVYRTGETYWGLEDKVDLMKGEGLQTGFFNFSYKPLRNEKGEIYGILNMAIDVSETVKSKNLLKESELHFRQLADLMPNKVANTDSKGNLIYFNQSWLEYTGADVEELKQEGWFKYVHPNEKEKAYKKWKKSLETDSNFEMELRLLQKSGRYKWHISRAEAIKDEDGNFKMWISTTTEIHKIKEEEKKKEDFLKMVSHELKTPVTSIKGYVQLLLSLLKQGRSANVQNLPLQPSLERIDHQIVRLTRLISEMLDLSRIEENKLELQKERFDLNKLVDQTVEDINYTNTQHKISVQHDFRCDVLADKDRIGQVLINFITNAVKYSPESRNIEVRVRQAGKDKVAVGVRDRGIGIDKVNHKKIFKRFYRIGGKSEDTYAGFGIGLYLANEIIQRHNGVIEVESKLGKGSEFSFVLAIASSDKN